MVAVNKSFCILLVLVIATVGNVVQTSDAAIARGYGGSPLGVGPLEDEKRCLVGLGECGVNVCTEQCCQDKCKNQFGAYNPEGFCIRFGATPNQLCYCYHNCS